LIKNFRFSRIFVVYPNKSSHAADLLPLSQAEGGCPGGKVTSMHSLYIVDFTVDFTKNLKNTTTFKKAF